MTKPRLLSAQPGENVIIATWENPEDNFEGTELKYKKVRRFLLLEFNCFY